MFKSLGKIKHFPQEIDKRGVKEGEFCQKSGGRSQNRGGKCRQVHVSQRFGIRGFTIGAPLKTQNELLSPAPNVRPTAGYRLPQADIVRPKGRISSMPAGYGYRFLNSNPFSLPNHWEIIYPRHFRAPPTGGAVSTLAQGGAASAAACEGVASEQRETRSPEPWVAM